MSVMKRPHLQIIELKPSLRLALLLGGVHLCMLALVATLPLAPWIRWCGTAVLLLSAVVTVFGHALRRSGQSVTALAFIDRTQLHVRTANGVWHQGRVLGTSTVGAALTVLNLQLDHRWRAVHVVIPADSLGTDDFRRLRVWLRWGPQASLDDAVVF